MLYSEHIANLASILRSIECTGIELKLTGHEQIYPNSLVHRQTFASSCAEVTLDVFPIAQLDPDDKDDTSFEFALLNGIRLLINKGDVYPEYKEAIDKQTRNISKLVGQYTSLADWYEVLLYLGYDLPECDWIYNY